MFLPVTVVTQLVRGVIQSSRGHLVSRTESGIVSTFHKRLISTTQCLWHGEYEWQDPKSENEVVRVVFIDKDGKRTEVRGKVGDNVLYLAHR